MSFKAGRLGPGDWLVSGGSAALLVDLFVPRWFAEPSGWQAFTGLHLHADQTGWQALSVLGPLTSVVGAAGLVVCWLRATRRSPALPTVLNTLMLPVTVIVFLLLVFRVLIDTPADTSARAGAYIGLVLCLGLVAGLYTSLRHDGVADSDSAAVVEVISVRAARPAADT